MEAAKAAARAFVERQPPVVRIGVVAFSDSGFSVQVPTERPGARSLAAIDRLEPGARDVARRSGILASLTAIAVAERPTRGRLLHEPLARADAARRRRCRPGRTRRPSSSC